MAKLLFFNVPAYGHVNPTLPVVGELTRRGHQVIYFNASTFAPTLAGTGAEFRPYPDSANLEVDFARRASNLADISVMMMEESLRLLPFVLDSIEREQPDRVIFDTIALWGMLAARLQGRPSAASIVTLISEGVPGILTLRDYPHIFRQAIPRLPALQRLRRRLMKTYGAAIFPGPSILPCRGDLNIVYTSREFQPATPYIDDSFHFVGPSILAATRQETGFPWEQLDPQRAKIYLSLGTLYNQKLAFYRSVFAAFSDHPAQFILSVGRQTDLQALSPAPDNFLVQPVVPQLELLQKVDVFITHGGMNSVNESLHYGVPLVVVPQQIEQAINGRQVARQAAGIVLADAPPYGRLDARILRQKVDQVLADPGYRRQAQRIGQSFRQAGGYQQAAALLSAGFN